MSLTRRKHLGFTLVEVLIALVILAVGLLGTASLMLMSMQSNQSASQRTVASLLAYDLAERMRINRSQAISGDYVFASTDAAPSNPSCLTSGCNNIQQRNQDIREWHENFSDVAGIGADGGDYRPAIAGATYTVTQAASNQYAITITWPENQVQRDPNSNNTDSSFTLRVEL